MFFLPMLAGAALGALTNKDNRLQGALLGGALGGIGGQFMPGLLGGSTATGGGFVGGGYGSIGLAGQTAGGASGFLGNTMAGIGADMTALGGYGEKAMQALNSNPQIAQMGMGMMQTAMQPRPPGPVLQGQIQRGQIAAPQFGGARMAQRRPMSLLG